MKLSFVVHAHQPPGNFDSVFHEAVERCYGPFLDLLDELPFVRLSLHFSGSLLEWLEREAPARVEQLRRQVERGQVEPVAAGLYEPVLALLPQRDRVGQLRAHRSQLRRLLGADTHAGWLTERVWEPSLAADLADGGIDVVPLDDRHFLSAGLTREELGEPFVTEYLGKPLVLAPAAESLRQAIPWRSVRQCVALIRRMAASGVALAVFGDDMEKFGLWPKTYASVVQTGWLRRFFTELAALRDPVELVPLGEAVAATPPSRRVYIPDGSYPEMLAWSLPPERQRELKRVRATLRHAQLADAVDPFLRSGVYFQFLAKYPEANHLHKRAIDVSAGISSREATTAARGEESTLPAATRALWRAQANCVYWHGWFGGTYLPHLRQAAWRSLLRAEQLLVDAGERARPLRVFDLDADGGDEAVVTNDTLTLVVDPAEGGAIVELSDRMRAVNLVDTLARRPEAYHPTGKAAPPYDCGRRALLIDRFLAPGAPPARNAEIVDRGDFCDRPYEMRATRDGDGTLVALRRTARALDGAARVEKSIRLADHGGAIDLRYRVDGTQGRVAGRFAVELNFGVFFQQVTRGHVQIDARAFPLRRGGAARSASCCEVALDDPAIAVRIESNVLAAIDARPVFTVSQSEQGIERTAQALACLLSWPIDLSAGDRFDVELQLTVGDPRPIGAP